MVWDNEVSFNMLERSKRYLKSVFWTQNMQTSDCSTPALLVLLESVKTILDEFDQLQAAMNPVTLKTLAKRL